MTQTDVFKIPYLRFKDEVGAQDLLKAIALLTMIIDHIGMCFLPEDLYLRAIGRSSSVIWFFFVGYNFRNHKKILDLLTLCAILFSIGKYLLISKLMPLHILFSMIICRIIVGYYAKYVVKNNDINLYEWLFLAIIGFCLFLLSNCFFEYGSLGLLIAIWGYNFRHKIGSKLIQTISVALITIVTQIDIWNFNYINSIICIISVGISILALHNFKPITLNIQGFTKYLINISARYSLYLYCFHLLLFFYIQDKLL